MIATSDKANSAALARRHVCGLDHGSRRGYRFPDLKGNPPDHREADSGVAKRDRDLYTVLACRDVDATTRAKIGSWVPA
jgi:hypothetical protein